MSQAIMTRATSECILANLRHAPLRCMPPREQASSVMLDFLPPAVAPELVTSRRRTTGSEVGLRQERCNLVSEILTANGSVP